MVGVEEERIWGVGGGVKEREREIAEDRVWRGRGRGREAEGEGERQRV